MIWAFILHLGVITVAFSAILVIFNLIMEAYGQEPESARENFRDLAGFLLAGGVLIAIGGLGMALTGWATAPA